ncbi:hypothetical protein JRO89_XS01G0097900 [Xanthoceras sorbifolium]|uniref:Glyoxalase At5g48480-like N-terminal domain-containing protein n=1 Tax=Xanthoceras sorbifolium TaxID=99658 RepID=A0ABQ8IJF5_9ROSI|nr:hypothetical protein JRO89_XS01G0097900 [Xanthoceras sorbifolium]
MAAVQEVQNGGGAEKAAAAAVTFSALKPQLLVEAPKATDAVQFYKNAFGAVETGRSMHTKRKAEQELPLILSAQLQIGGFSFLVSDLADDSAAAPYVSLFYFSVSVSLYIWISLSVGARRRVRGSDSCSAWIRRTWKLLFPRLWEQEALRRARSSKVTARVVAGAWESSRIPMVSPGPSAPLPRILQTWRLNGR